MKHFSRKSTLQTKAVLDWTGGVGEGSGAEEREYIESLYKVCHANPLWSPREERKREKKNVEAAKMLMCAFTKFFEGLRPEFQTA